MPKTQYIGYFITYNVNVFKISKKNFIIFYFIILR